MVLDPPKTPPKPKPNRALASHTRGEYIEYASSDQYIRIDRDEARPARYDSSHRHEKSCRCIDCRLYRWQLERSAWRDFEAHHGALPPLPAHRPISEKEIANWNRIVELRYWHSIARLRRVERWYVAACSCRTYPPVWMIDQIFGDDCQEPETEFDDAPLRPEFDATDLQWRADVASHSEPTPAEDDYLAHRHRH